MRSVAITIAAAVVGAAFLAGACLAQSDSCNGFGVNYCLAIPAPGDPPCQGHIIDSTHWETGPITGDWLQYNAEETFTMQMRDAVTGDVLSGQIASALFYVGATQTQDAGILPAVCANQLCEVLQTDPSTFFLRNDTCSSEFVYAIVTIIPTATATDGGSE